MIQNDIPDYQYIIDRYYRQSHKGLNARIFDNIFCYFNPTDQFHFLCSWFCEDDVNNIQKMKYEINNCHFYDHDELVCNYNNQYAKNVHHDDVIFDELDIEGVFINKYCEYTYPVGKIYKGEFILVGCDEEKLYLPNTIKSCDDLINQNNITDVYDTETWTVIREYDKKEINYYLVTGCNT